MKTQTIVYEDNEGIRELLEIVLTTPTNDVYATDIAEDVVMRHGDVYIFDSDLGVGKPSGDQIASIVKHHNPDAYLVSHSSRDESKIPEGLYHKIIQKPVGIMDLKNIVDNYNKNV